MSDLLFRIRLLFYGLGFIQPLFIPFGKVVKDVFFDPPIQTLVILFAVCLFSTILIPIMLLTFVGIQAINPFSDKTWTRPSHRSNPLYLGNPLFILHFAAFFAGFGGFGAIVSFPWNGVVAVGYGVLVFVGSAMFLIGLELCMRVFKHKMGEHAVPSDAWESLFRQNG